MEPFLKEAYCTRSNHPSPHSTLAEDVLGARASDTACYLIDSQHPARRY